MKKLLFILSVMFLLNIYASAQKQYVSNTSGSQFGIHGTSTLHDWDLSVSDFSIKFDAVYTNNILSSIGNVNVAVTSKSLKSKEGKAMDDKVYEALKVDKYSTIKFTSTKTVSFLLTGTTLKGEIQGNLTLAGITKVINIPFTGNINGSAIIINGSKKIKMTDYGITPPTAVFGTIKSGDEVTLNFKIALTEKLTTH